ncbi:NADH-quinone oxidoreductase subunit NuoE [Natronoglycomyces albus]|uniref:NADH-quinone oxidoreductase subunit NuoE n=1 Tax=Natronoglycomyces albus TaxID=2811108 RepID=A0A895XW37_9ACTN|nr:NADH-quinone oxidoreductase subunit NuoE [Natronoglycomyces albus]QSB05848.1 NADH-quinone oxidoreductase subunit NuoE [Natronoglycomyces albus]
MAYSEEIHASAEEIKAQYPEGRERSALLPLLHLVQSVDGYITPEGTAFCAEKLGITKAQVQAVSTFYTMYKRNPTGDWLVSVCTNTMCDALGGQKIYDRLSDHLKVGHDETTADGKITLEHAECLAACDYGPVMTVNYEFFDNMDEEQALEVVNQLQEGKIPVPSRGAPLCTLKQISVQLAGYGDERDEGNAGTGAGDSTLVGLQLAAEHGVTAPQFDPDTPLVSKEEAQ